MPGNRFERRQQHVAVLEQAIDGFVVFGRVLFLRRSSWRLPPRRGSDLAQILVRIGLHGLRQLVENIQGLVHPAPLMARRWKNFSERFREAKRAVADRNLWRD